MTDKKNPPSSQGERNNEQYHMELPPVNFQKNSNVVSQPHVDDLKTKR